VRLGTEQIPLSGEVPRYCEDTNEPTVLHTKRQLSSFVFIIVPLKFQLALCVSFVNHENPWQRL
jgi:hypothetical protein